MLVSSNVCFLILYASRTFNVVEMLHSCECRHAGGDLFFRSRHADSTLGGKCVSVRHALSMLAFHCTRTNCVRFCFKDESGHPVDPLGACLICSGALRMFMLGI